jgi:hypothetical protein
MIRSRQSGKKDAAVCIVGFKGQGKTTCAWKIAHKLGKYQIENKGTIYDAGNYIPEKDMVYSRQDAIDFIMNRRYSVLHVDEMINVGYNREFSNSDQQAIVKALNQYRSPHYNVYLMCNPMFYDLDPDFRNLFWMRIDVIRRGFALVHTANESIYGNDPWETAYNKKVEQSWKEQKSGKIRPKYHQLTTFRGILLYGPMRESEEVHYERIRDEKRNKANAELRGEVVDKKQKNMYDSLIQLGKEGKLTREQLEFAAKMSNRDLNSFRATFNRYLKKIGETITTRDLVKEVDNQPTNERRGEVDELGYPIVS